jgi:hypothetical protein
MRTFFEKLKIKWGIRSHLQLALILIVFSLAGSTAVAMKKVYFNILGIDETTHFALRTIAYIAFLFPSYQLLLLGYGFLLGQFRFFWEKEKKLFELIFQRGRKRS